MKQLCPNLEKNELKLMELQVTKIQVFNEKYNYFSAKTNGLTWWEKF